MPRDLSLLALAGAAAALASSSMRPGARDDEDESAQGHLRPRTAPPPVETPGPSVTAPLVPESETERREWADATKPDAEQLGTTDPIDELVAEEESAAAAEARMIGGPAPREVDDPAMDPVYQAGGGEQDGWEAAEQDLIANATHGDGGGNPLRDAFPPEAESDRSTALYGGADELASTEVVEDPDEGDDDPGAGPGLGFERGS
jgi:hypothetical protein